MVKFFSGYIALLILILFRVNISCYGQEAVVFENLVIDSNVTISSGIQLTNQGDIDMEGKFHFQEDFTNDGNLSITSGTFIFDSPDSVQYISGSNPIILYDLEINNGAPGSVLILNRDVEITNELDFTDGIIAPDATSLLIFNQGATFNNAFDNSHVRGRVRKVGNESFLFPVGGGTSYNPCLISAPASVTDHFTAEYIDANPSDDSYNVYLREPVLNHVSTEEYWIIDRTNGSSDVTVTLYWDTLSYVDTLNDLRVARWDGTEWKNEGNGGVSGDSNDGYIVSGGPVTSFSPFTLASISVFNPLPIELVYFDAQKDEEQVYLSWVTQSETNSAFFVVEKSRDGQNNWTPVLQKMGAGNSSYKILYEDYDKTPYLGSSYYRLKHVDLDGTFTYSEIRHVNFDKKYGESALIVYPNPVDEVATIEFSDVNEDPNAFIIVFDSQGKELIKQRVDLSQKHYVDVSLLSRGAYTIFLYSTNNLILNAKIIVNH